MIQCFGSFLEGISHGLKGLYIEDYMYRHVLHITGVGKYNVRSLDWYSVVSCPRNEIPLICLVSNVTHYTAPTTGLGHFHSEKKRATKWISAKPLTFADQSEKENTGWFGQILLFHHFAIYFRLEKFSTGFVGFVEASYVNRVYRTVKHPQSSRIIAI